MSIPSVAPPGASMPTHAVQPPDVLLKPAVAPVTGAQGGKLSSSTDQQGPNEALERALETLNRGLRAWATNLRFEVDPEADRVVVQIIDAETGDVVRQIPSEEVVQMSRALGRLQDLAFRASA